MKDSLTDEKGKWVKIGQGSFNIVYYNQENNLVFKVPIQNTDKKMAKLDQGKRPQELWNLINSNLKPVAAAYEIEGMIGWTCPYIKGKAATDSEISFKLTEIYNKTGRIVIDAMGWQNFITIEKGPNRGQTICIDVGLALLLNKSNELPKSQTSLDAWDAYKSNVMDSFSSSKIQYYFPKTVVTIKALLFLQEFNQFLNADFLHGKYEGKKIAKLLADMYDLKNQKSIHYKDKDKRKILQRTVNELIHNNHFDQSLFPKFNYFLNENNKNKEEEKKSVAPEEKKYFQPIPTMEDKIRHMPKQAGQLTARDFTVGADKFTLFSHGENLLDNSKLNSSESVQIEDDLSDDIDEGSGADRPSRH
ncbi:Uncharacterised protein [Legionella beliardensis]|uniref:Uncharacterized protein n=1 Tax=Legionella beliardensis TaxID=91822 RepID=A0A378I3D2_9GAMM|nr:hypothetical protein [Legionella beliardensis]STX29196.1 Uncharacterised protein [Legionella beliardensis]